MQQTTFPFEAVVHDDASTDGSVAIILEYAERYPDIIKPIFETENQYSKHDNSLTRVLDNAVHPRAKYVAICEGDDYWTDPQKLQIQINFLEDHPDYSLAVHDFKVYDEAEQCFRDYRPIDLMGDDEEYRTLTMKEFKKGLFFTQALTSVYRISALKNSHYDSYNEQFDMTMFFALMTQGKCVLFNRVMGVYRRHSGSATAGWNGVTFHLRMDENLLHMCEKENTSDFLDFVYYYFKPFAFRHVYDRHWGFMSQYVKYLGWRRGLKLLLYDPARIVLGLACEKVFK
jgi:glycosyltransferase involved in cell wall biosynthesis